MSTINLKVQSHKEKIPWYTLVIYRPALPIPVSSSVSYDKASDCHNFVKWFPAQYLAGTHTITRTETQRYKTANMFRSLLLAFFLPYLSLSLVLSLPLEQLGQGRRSSYSFLIKLSLCHPGPQSHGGGDCWQENEAYEWVRSASDRFMGQRCQHMVEENKMFEHQSPSDVHQLQTLVQSGQQVELVKC